jgi:hypothetical protein
MQGRRRGATRTARHDEFRDQIHVVATVIAQIRVKGGWGFLILHELPVQVLKTEIHTQTQATTQEAHRQTHTNNNEKYDSAKGVAQGSRGQANAQHELFVSVANQTQDRQGALVPRHANRGHINCKNHSKPNQKRRLPTRIRSQGTRQTSKHANRTQEGVEGVGPFAYGASAKRTAVPPNRKRIVA